MVDDVGRAPFVAFRFAIAVQVAGGAAHGLSSPLCSAAFSECSGLEATMEPKLLREGGNNYEQIYLPGQVSYGQVTLKRGMTPNLDLWRWFELVTRRGLLGARAETEVKLLDADGSLALTFVLSDCLPVKLKAPTLAAREGGLAIEELSLTYSSFRIG